MTNLTELLRSTSDEDLLCIYEELYSGIVPASGFARKFCRKVNNKIDKGEMQISPASYRKVYLPTLHKAITVELSARYMNAINKGMIQKW